jgi:hypothetical protein
MATAALASTENSFDFTGLISRQSTEMESPEDRLAIWKRKFLSKVGNWPSEQRIGHINDRDRTGTISPAGKTQWIHEIAPFSAYQGLVDLVNAWGNAESLISQIRLSPQICHAERIAVRLNDLRCMALEEDGESADISAESVQTFFSFLKMHPGLRYPDITLTPDGNVYSRWKGDNGALLGIEFLPESKVAYVVFAPAPSHAGELSRHSGIDFTDTFFVRINTAFSVADWILE